MNERMVKRNFYLLVRFGRSQPYQESAKRYIAKGDVDHYD